MVYMLNKIIFLKKKKKKEKEREQKDYKKQPLGTKYKEDDKDL